jgi:HAD superfamily hydrolase (TIGR01509 family)
MRAVVFDFDGLILDTESSIFASWCAAFAAHGCVPPTLDEWSVSIGTADALDVVALLRSRAPIELDVDAMQAERRAHRDRMLAMERVRPGVVEWIDEARARGMSCAVASSSEIEWVGPHLDRLGIRDAFTHLACWSTTLRAKPHPDTYLAACAALGVEPGDALAIEDSPNGIAAARAAGLRVVAVPNDITAHLDLSAADVQLPSLAACSLGDVMARLDG